MTVEEASWPPLSYRFYGCVCLQINPYKAEICTLPRLAIDGHLHERPPLHGNIVGERDEADDALIVL